MIKETVRKIEPEIYLVYRRLHENPEPGMEEYETSRFLRRRIEAGNLADELLAVGETGLLAVLRGKRRDGAVLLRGDMDALRIQEDEGHDPRSRREGLMHACGHDAHAAMLFGALLVLGEYRDSLETDIYFYFQPGEELLVGAELLLDSGLVPWESVGAVAAAHIIPDLYAGEVGLTTGPMLAGADHFTVVVQGRGGHGAHPHTTVDPVVAAASIIMALQTLTAREVSALDTAVVSVCSVHSDGRALNVIPDRVTLGGTIRTLLPETRSFLRERFPALVESAAAVHRAEAQVEYEEGPPPFVNDQALAIRAIRVLGELLGPDSVKTEGVVTMGAEDFAYIRARRPGIFMRVGCRTPGSAFTPIHSGRLTVDRAALATGTTALAGVALDFTR
ncbi:MAG: amidohydrolase [Gracilibacteraceae bacterium]|nr:amidohydrolase [Gracilibacteraceae bacterium]